MTQWIAGMSRGHNGGVCLLKDGEIVFNIEEERLSRAKYDGAPLRSLQLIAEYTDKLDYLVMSHTTPIEQHKMLMDYCGNDPYYGLLRKMGLLPTIEDFGKRPDNVIDLARMHHRLHAASAFYNSGFETATAVVVDGAGSWTHFGPTEKFIEDYWETETIFDCAYPAKFDTKYKHIGTKFATPTCYYRNFDVGFWCNWGEEINYESPENVDHELFATPNAGIVKTYEGVTEYCGFPAIEAGKTMGLSPYGKDPGYLPPFFVDDGMIDVQVANRMVFTPYYPNGTIYNLHMIPEVSNMDREEGEQLYDLQNRKDAAYMIQKETQQQVANLIRKAVRMTGNKNVIVVGGYGLNCVANYYYLDELKDEGINLYVEPVSNDSGTAMGAALFWHHWITGDTKRREKADSLYLGPKYEYNKGQITRTCKKYGAELVDGSDEDVIDLITNKNIVAMYQGRSESGPRALGNRSILYDPRDPNGKDHVNTIKRREFFRPFAGSILKEDVHEWFDLRGMDETPHMMYAVNCQPGIEEKIPSIIHEDGTCRIQTVTEKQNPNYHRLISKFKEKTGCPILFNTSFNLGGEPLVETLDDAVRTIANSDIEYLYLPEYGKLISVKND